MLGRRLTGAAIAAGALAVCVGVPLAVQAGFNFNATLVKTHQGNFAVGSNGTFTITLSDSSGAAFGDTYTVTDNLPGGLSYVTAGGPSFSCSNSGQVVTCTGSPTFTTTGQSQTMTVVAGVGVAAFPGVTNTASFHDAAGIDNRSSDNTAVDTVSVDAVSTGSSTSTTPTSGSTTTSSPSSSSSSVAAITAPSVGGAPGMGGAGVIVALAVTVGGLGSVLGVSALRRRR